MHKKTFWGKENLVFLNQGAASVMYLSKVTKAYVYIKNVHFTFCEHTHKPLKNEVHYFHLTEREEKEWKVKQNIINE